MLIDEAVQGDMGSASFETRDAYSTTPLEGKLRKLDKEKRARRVGAQVLVT